MDRYEKETRIRVWGRQQFVEFDLQIRMMEDEIQAYRRESLDKLAPSSFSYHLYEKKTKRMRLDWNHLYAKGCISQWAALDALIKERIREVIKQDKITAEDYPKNRQVLQIKELHEKKCMEWLICLHFNGPIPKRNQPSSKG